MSTLSLRESPGYQQYVFAVANDSLNCGTLILKGVNMSVTEFNLIELLKKRRRNHSIM
jgi:hypothetical protein